MPQSRYHGPPIDLRNMRDNGVRSISISCHLCHHTALLNVDAFAETVVVPSFGPRMVCTGCGIIGAEVRPARKERPTREIATLRVIKWEVKGETGDSYGVAIRYTDGIKQMYKVGSRRRAEI
jgi:hypothetical protein